MIPEIKFPERDVLISHVISSLDEYWEKNSEHVLSLPVCNYQNNFKAIVPLKLVSVNLPNWADSCGIESRLLVPQECVDKNNNSIEWWKVDWWLAIFLMLEGWHERVWESIHGSIHSYSYRLKNWDSRVWDHAWVNRICLFLRKWGEKKYMKEKNFFGRIPKSELILSHDVDAVCKTHPIRIKQSAFHIFNSLNLLLKLKISDSIKKLTKGIKFFLSNEDWWIFDKLLKIKEGTGITAVYHFYSDQRPKTLKRWLMDPNYDIGSDQLKLLLRQIKDAGHEVGLHPTYDAWKNSKLIEEQKKTLEESLGSKVTYCRQHWLRFSWKDTWLNQARSGLTQDSTLMFNDRSGFRNSCATSWKPWNQLENKAHSVVSTTSVVMDSHLYDYNDFNKVERNDYLRFWIMECHKVGGKTSLLWHPHSLSKDYGWLEGFKDLINILK